MSLVRFNPRRTIDHWRPFADLHSQIDRLFEGIVSESNGEDAVRVPAVDVVEHEDRLVLTADLPGVSKENIDVTVHENVLTLSAKREIERETEEKGFKHFERVSGQFRRTVNLPAEVDADKVTAEYRDGVLTITAQKRPEALPRSVQVNVN